MKVITKMELQPDMVLGEDILDQNRVIYPAGTTVTPQIMEKLKRYDLVCVTIMEDEDFATTITKKYVLTLISKLLNVPIPFSSGNISLQ